MKRRDWDFVRGFTVLAVISFLLLQLWPRNQTNPPVVSEPVWDSKETADLVQQACFDCHSYETEWPWYTAIVPISNLLEYDVSRGRKILNFSEWDQDCCTQEQIERMAAIVGRDQMPPPYYAILHPDARLSTTERGKLIYGLISTMENKQNQE